LNNKEGFMSLKNSIATDYNVGISVVLQSLFTLLRNVCIHNSAGENSGICEPCSFENNFSATALSSVIDTNV
jgi:hypothetical protein